jgi:hypothetical protein
MRTTPAEICHDGAKGRLRRMIRLPPGFAASFQVGLIALRRIAPEGFWRCRLETVCGAVTDASRR